MELAVVLVVLSGVILVRLVAGARDPGRVAAYIRSLGGEILDSHWRPFGRGWFGEQGDRIYQVKYRDPRGNVHRATVKTSMLSGVYFTEDRIISGTRSDEARLRELEAEVAQLRQRIAELEGKASE